LSNPYFPLHDPHSFLGLHPFSKQKVIRLFRPKALEIYIELFGEKVRMNCVDEEGIFERSVPLQIERKDYRIYHQNGLLAHDPYAFSPTWGELDSHLFHQGVHYQLYEVMGGRSVTHQGVLGVKFAVWAPAAVGVAVVGDFNYWDGRVNPMRSMGYSGVWELFIPGIGPGEKYKFEVRTKEGFLNTKADPYALWSEERPKTASVVFNIEGYSWHDQSWMEQRKNLCFENVPMTIYEVHLGSWKKNGEDFLNYRDLAHDLASYCKEMGFTHVELMPVAEHPLDESWGYQVSGYYSVSSRYGTPADFQYFVDHLHQNKVGVIIDWVAAHFPTDDFSLSRFDGTALYEHEDPRLGFHPHWHTHIFNYGRKEVSNFLIANALFWFDKMHIDGLRVDAVASMLYLDYGREGMDWVPNRYGGNENLEAIEFLRHLNSIVHERFSGILTIAEESSAFSGITHRLNHGGLGFDFKWNMGWMNDTLRYFQKEPIFRCFHHDDLTFGILYVFSEKFILPLSHDEVVHRKKSLLSKMPGDIWQKFAHLRLLYSYMMCQPGKKLFFMGGEIGQWDEWNCKEALQWNLLQFPFHAQLKEMIKQLNKIYLQRTELWEWDCQPRGFEWIDFWDREGAVISYLRKSSTNSLLCLHHFTPQYFPEYVLKLPAPAKMVEIFNSDREEFGGSGKTNGLHNRFRKEHTLSIAPLATQIFELVWTD
jgi:1,4-alpha-glucan branching enzyme